MHEMVHAAGSMDLRCHKRNEDNVDVDEDTYDNYYTFSEDVEDRRIVDEKAQHDAD